jgi:hypothetical protein
MLLLSLPPMKVSSTSKMPPSFISGSMRGREDLWHMLYALR